MRVVFPLESYMGEGEQRKQFFLKKEPKTSFNLDHGQFTSTVQNNKSFLRSFFSKKRPLFLLLCGQITKTRPG
jgi:hypothetical protein